MINRSTVYDILSEELNTYKVIVNNRPYNKLFIPREWEWSMLRINDTYIRDFHNVYLCTDELVIRGKYDSIQINVPYKSIDLLEVYGDEEEY